MNIWHELKQFGLQHFKASGSDTFETSLLGFVDWRIVSGEYTGYIPRDLQSAAKEHGLVIEAALFRDGKYVLRLMVPNVELTGGASAPSSDLRERG